MKKNKYIIGAVAGATSLAIAFPLVAQLASAAGAGANRLTPEERMANRPAPSQACVQALVEKDTNFLSSVDEMISAHKAAVQAHKDALTAAAAITDDAQRKAAVDTANTAFREAMKTSAEAHREEHQTEMEALKEACGDSVGFGMGHGFEGSMIRGKGPMKGGVDFPMNKGGRGRGQSFGNSSAG